MTLVPLLALGGALAALHAAAGEPITGDGAKKGERKKKTTIWNVTPRKLIKRPRVVTVDQIVQNRFNETDIFENCKSLSHSRPIFFPKLASAFVANTTECSEGVLQTYFAGGSVRWTSI